MTTQTVVLRVSTTRAMPGLADTAAIRVYTIDGVENVTVLDAAQDIAPKETLERKIRAFNKLYGLRCADKPEIWHTHKAEFINYLTTFRNILEEKVREVEAIKDQAIRGEGDVDLHLELLTHLADWLGDIVVYAISEMQKFGIPADLVLGIIMASNMSKLGADGKPIYDERGKVMKGPNYWAPEPQIRRALQALIRQAAKAEDIEVTP